MRTLSLATIHGETQLRLFKHLEMMKDEGGVFRVFRHLQRESRGINREEFDFREMNGNLHLGKQWVLGEIKFIVFKELPLFHQYLTENDGKQN